MKSNRLPRRPRSQAKPAGSKIPHKDPTRGEPNAASTQPLSTPDLVYVHAAQADTLHVIRMRPDRVETGELRPLRHGEPIVGELVKLHSRQESDCLFDCEVIAQVKQATRTAPTHTDQHPAPLTSHQAELGHKGPARANSDAYRENWEVIFGGPRSTPSNLN